jgi:hypothetical protein
MSKKRTGLENFFTDISGVDFIAKLDEEKKQKELQEQKKIEEAAEKQRQIVAQKEKRKLSETKKLSVLENLFGVQEFKEQIKETIESNAKVIKQKSPEQEQKLLETLENLYGSITKFAEKQPNKQVSESLVNQVEDVISKNIKPEIPEIDKWSVQPGDPIPATKEFVDTATVYDVLSKNAKQITEDIETGNMSLDELSKSFNKFKQLTTLQLQSIGGGGAGDLKDLGDVDVSAQQNGFALKYNSSTGKYDFGEVASDLSAVDQNIIPDTDNARDIGSSSKNFRNGYFKNVYVSGSTLEVSNDTTLKGDTVIGVNTGDSTEDTVNVVARFISNLEPLTTLTHDLGSPARRWRDIYLSGNTIDLAGATISGDGTGAIQISATGATLPAGSKIGTDKIAKTNAEGTVTKSVPFFTQAGGLSTANTTFTMAAGSSKSSVFTAFKKADGSTQGRFELFSF